MTARSILAALLSLALGACTGPVETGSPPPPTATPTRAAPSPEPVELTIYGAASLKTVLERIKSEYEANNPELTLTISTDASSAIEAKIEQGAPADVFLSADTANPQKLLDGGFAGEPLIRFAQNELTIIVPKDNPAEIESPMDLAEDGVRIIAAGESVPITKYATQLVANLAQQPGYPAGFAAAYEANVASHEENVAAIVGKIALGQGDAGIVYVTDAATSDAVRSIDIPPDANVLATYAGAAVRASKHEADARAFLAWLAGPSGQAVLAGFGFLPRPT
jgi:molybdate transport system substrate-binding protein